MSEPRSPVTGEPVDVHEQQAREREAKEKAEKAVKQKVVEVVDELGKIVRKTIGPPGTP
jgi:hypothetical protein